MPALQTPGLPVAVKDLTAVKGLPFTQGSLLFKERVAQHNDPLAQRLEDKGAVIVGELVAAEVPPTGRPNSCTGMTIQRLTVESLMSEHHPSCSQMCCFYKNQSRVSSTCSAHLQARPTPPSWVLVLKPTTRCLAQHSTPGIRPRHQEDHQGGQQQHWQQGR